MDFVLTCWFNVIKRLGCCLLLVFLLPFSQVMSQESVPSSGLDVMGVLNQLMASPKRSDEAYQKTIQKFMLGWKAPSYDDLNLLGEWRAETQNGQSIFLSFEPSGVVYWLDKTTDGALSGFGEGETQAYYRVDLIDDRYRMQVALFAISDKALQGIIDKRGLPAGGMPMMHKVVETLKAEGTLTLQSSKNAEFSLQVVFQSLLGEVQEQIQFTRVN